MNLITLMFVYMCYICDLSKHTSMTADTFTISVFLIHISAFSSSGFGSVDHVCVSSVDIMSEVGGLFRREVAPEAGNRFGLRSIVLTL